MDSNCPTVTFVPTDLPLQEPRKDFELELLAVDSSLDSFPRQERAPLARKLELLRRDDEVPVEDPSTAVGHFAAFHSLTDLGY